MLTFRTVMAGPVPAIRSVDLPRLMAGTVAGHDDERRVTTFGFWYNRFNSVFISAGAPTGVRSYLCDRWVHF